VSGHQEVVALWGVTVLGLHYLLVSAVHAHAQHLDQNAPSIRNVVHLRFRQIGQMYAVGLAWNDGYRFH
jgi:hypothetical protein